MGKLCSECAKVEVPLVDVKVEDLEFCICGTSRIPETRYENHSGKNTGFVVS